MTDLGIITDEMYVEADKVADERVSAWRMQTNRNAYIGFMARQVAYETARRLAPLIAAQVLRDAAAAHESYDDTLLDYVGHEDRCDYGPPPCECSKGRTAVWLRQRAEELFR